MGKMENGGWWEMVPKGVATRCTDQSLSSDLLGTKLGVTLSYQCERGNGTIRIRIPFFLLKESIKS